MKTNESEVEPKPVRPISQTESAGIVPSDLANTCSPAVKHAASRMPQCVT